MKPPWDAIAWWELRRIPYNLLLAALGLSTIFIIVEIGSRFGPDAGLPLNPFGLVLGVIAYGVAANVFYTLGWITELLWSRGDTSRTEAMRRTVFWTGVIGSSLLTVSPAVLFLLAWVLSGFAQKI